MEYRILRSRRKTIAIEITPQGEVLVRCPNRTSQKEIQHLLMRRKDWIAAHLSKLSQEPRPVPLTPDEITALASCAKQTIPSRVAYFAEILGVSYGRISIRSQHTRWGSCSSAGNLNFNCLLMLAPPEILDYVVVHELCHRKEMNHSPRFWVEVEKILPDYRAKKHWLKENGSALMARLPK